jgi:hypothetical protein
LDWKPLETMRKPAVTKPSPIHAEQKQTENASVLKLAAMIFPGHTDFSFGGVSCR